jgi:hypothetical protein
MPSFEAELIRQIGGRGHVCFGHSYSFAAGYVCILLAALARIYLAQFSHVKSAAGALALHGLWRLVPEPLFTLPDQNFTLRHASVIHAALTPQGNRYRVTLGLLHVTGLQVIAPRP